jgi:hypothetical protein
MVEKAERDIECLPETAVGIVADLSGVDDRANPELPRLIGPGQACVVVSQ